LRLLGEPIEHTLDHIRVPPGHRLLLDRPLRPFFCLADSLLRPDLADRIISGLSIPGIKPLGNGALILRRLCCIFMACIDKLGRAIPRRVWRQLRQLIKPIAGAGQAIGLLTEPLGSRLGIFCGLFLHCILSEHIAKPSLCPLAFARAAGSAHLVWLLLARPAWLADIILARPASGLIAGLAIGLRSGLARSWLPLVAAG